MTISKISWLAALCPLAITITVALTMSPLAQAQDAELLGHWQLRTDAKDSSGHDHHATNRGVTFADGSGRFDGRASYLQVPSSPELDLGNDPFAITAWVHTEGQLDDGLGDILSKFDADSRTGFTLNLKHNVGATNSQANYRHLEFGINRGRIDPEWTDRGRPGAAVLIFSMAAFDDELFVGTCVAGKEQAGRVYRYVEGGEWIDCGAPDKSNAVSAMAVHEGQLYVGTAKYRLAGSSLDESGNLHPGGSIFRYEGDQKWARVGALPEREGVNGLVVYRGKLYASSMYQPAGFFRYEGGSEWTDCGVPDGKRVEQLSVFNGQLFATSYDGGVVFRYDGEDWHACGQLGDNTQTYAFCVNDGHLFVGTWPSGKVFRYAADHDWIDTGRLGGEKEVMGMALYNGKMYAGTLPLAEVYRYDGGTTWTRLGQVDKTPDVKYRRAWTMAVFRGELFVGTLPSGKVMSLRAGEVVTRDRALPSGWVHVAAVREAGQMKLYVDGKLVASRVISEPSQYDLNNGEPLKIGFGPHDYFNGKMQDLRLYRGGLDQKQVAEIAALGRPE